MASNSKVVHCKTSKYDVYIGRPSKWGGTREDVIQKYREWLFPNLPIKSWAVGALRTPAMAS